MQKQSIKKIALTRLLYVFIISMLVILAVILLSYRNFFHFVVENEVQSVSEIIKAGLTSHMKAGIMEKRDYFFREISSVHDIESIEIIRADAVINQFGESTLSEKKLDNTLREILEKKEMFIEWNDEQSRVEAIIPYVASSSGSFNCLECHNVADGTVLGAVNISMNTGIYQSFVIRNTYLIAGALFLSALIVVLNMYHVIERYIRKPLLNLIREGESAYLIHEGIVVDKYESKEFEEVVDNINKFNKTVIDKEKELESKNEQLQLLNEEIELTLKETMLAVGHIEEIRSGDTSMHTKRVALISKLIAQEYGLNDDEINLIEIASPLHDIGKIGISDAVLNKPSKLTHEEYENMKTHSHLGYEILKNSNRRVLKTAAIIAHEHHEKFDGTGYPRGLKGDEISIYARIVAIVDVVDALLSTRVYKDSWSVEKVIVLLHEESGKHFDPKLVDIMLNKMDEYSQLIKKSSSSS